jgi:hypothetical protein
MTACATPIAFEQLVDYWTNELDESALATIEEHLFSCGDCTAQMERVHLIVGAFRGQMPPIVSTEQVAQLRSSGARIEENRFEPGIRREVTFPPTLDFMIHHLAGLNLADATRVSVTVRSEGSGAVIHVEHFAPFDREQGEVVIACQKHFAAFPPDILVEVRVHTAAGALPALATYPIPHVFVQAK